MIDKLRKILEKKQDEFYMLKKQHGDHFNHYCAFQAMVNNHDLDKLDIEIKLLKQLLEE